MLPSKLKALVLAASVIIASCSAQPVLAAERATEEYCARYSEIAVATKERFEVESAASIKEKVLQSTNLSDKGKARIVDLIYFVENRKNLPDSTIKTFAFLKCQREFM